MHCPWPVFVCADCCTNTSQPVKGDIATLALSIERTVQNKVWGFCVLLRNSSQVRLLLFPKSEASILLR